MLACAAAQLRQRLDLPFPLPLGSRTESVTVTGVTPLLQTANAELGDVIDNRQVVQLPLNGRQFLQLAQLSDGVVVPPGGTRGAALEQAGALPAVLGQRSGHNIYLLDGVKVTDEFFNNLVVSPSIDAIQEFKIQKTMYPAEFGGKASALINVATKSGSNEYRGGALEFFRSDRFDAHNYFDDPTKRVPPLRQHQFGAHIGGPLRQDRSFFFASYEGQRIHRSLTQTFSVPPASVRIGNFAGLAALCDPLTRTAAGCAPFADNQIPAGRIDPVARALLRHVPEPTGDGLVQNLLAIGTEENPMDQVTLRVDHRLSGNDTLFGRFTAFGVRDTQPFGTSSLNETLIPGFGRTVTTRSRNVALSYTHTFSTSILNEMRFGWLTAGGGQMSPNQGANFATAAGLLTRNWRVSGIVTIQSGAPFTVNLGTDRANIGAGPAQRPDTICDPNAGAPRTPEHWFNTACFVLPAPFTFGNSGRNTVLAPGYADVDVAVSKDVPLSNTARLELRWEIFNALNRANFDVPNRTAFTPNFRPGLQRAARPADADGDQADFRCASPSSRTSTRI